MNRYLWLPAVGFLLNACVHDAVDQQSPPQPTRSFAGVSAREDITRPEGATGKFASDRVYLITRLETADQTRGEWRAVGSTIQQNGTSIRFIELGTGKIVEFTAPHQIAPMASRHDRRVMPNVSDPISAPSTAGGVAPASTAVPLP